MLAPLPSACSSSSSSSSVVHLDSDDDVTIVDPPCNARHTDSELDNPRGRTASMPPLPASAVSSSPVVPSALSDLYTAHTLTDSSEHRFPSYTLLREWMDAYAKERGYQVRWKSTGAEAGKLLLIMEEPSAAGARSSRLSSSRKRSSRPPQLCQNCTLLWGIEQVENNRVGRRVRRSEQMAKG